jgi:hypothetical protein
MLVVMAIWLVQGFVLWQQPQPFVLTYCVMAFGEAATVPTVSVGDVAAEQGRHTRFDTYSTRGVQLLHGR